MKLRSGIILTLFITLPFLSSGYIGDAAHKQPILTGADQTALYLPYLKGKKVGMLVNQTSVIGNKSIVDSLRA